MSLVQKGCVMFCSNDLSSATAVLTDGDLGWFKVKVAKAC